MKISVCQVYVEPDASFPFTYVFQAHVGKLLTAETRPRKAFEDRYGEQYDLVFNMSAKKGLATPEVKGPARFERWKTVEYTIFLPYGPDSSCTGESLKSALNLLFASIQAVLLDLGMSCAALHENRNATIRDILQDNAMTKNRA